MPTEFPLTNPDELFDIVDDHDCVIGQAPRREAHARRLKHRAVHILLFNDDGELFLQKRAATKDSHPGKYDSSASGHLAAGEDYDTCAVRELAEELGLTVPPSAWHKCFQIPACADTGQEFVWVYCIQGNYQPVINPAEIESGQFWPLERIAREISRRPAQFAPSFIRVYSEYSRRP